MIVDAHVHTRGHEKAENILRAMDRVGITRACLLSPPKLEDSGAQRESLAWMRDLTAAAPDRLLGYFWLNPLLPDADRLIQEAAATPGIRAFKLMADHWYPHDDSLESALAAIERTGKPILFHSGVLWSHMDSSRYCRPAEFEVMLEYPSVRFTLAHMAWPWIDECFAVADRMRHGIRELTGGPSTMYVDLSPGTPMAVREEALRRAVLLGDTDRLLFGSDDTDPEKLDKAAEILAFDREMLGMEIELPDKTMDRIFGLNLLEFLGIAA
jgi:predicted TIM-barrel fold metal-dependent hydrolase